MNKALVIGAVAASSLLLVACQQPATNPAAVEQKPVVQTPVVTPPVAPVTDATQAATSSASLSILPAGETPSTDVQKATSTATLSIAPGTEGTTQSANVDAKLEIQPKN